MIKQRDKSYRTSLVILVLLLFGLFAACLIIAFFAKESDIQRWMLFGTFFFGFGSISVSICALAISIKSYLNVEKEKRLRAKSEAQEFVTSFEDELDLLPLCVISNSYSNLHKYSRDIYNAFNRLDDLAKKEVLFLLNVEYDLIKSNSWIDSSLKTVRQFIADYDLGKDVLYDNAKYYRDMINMPEAEYSFEEEFEHCCPDYSPLKKYKFENELCFVEKVSFFDYLRQYVIYKFKKDPLIISYKSKPIDYYCSISRFNNCVSYKCSLIVVNIVDSVSNIIMEIFSECNKNVKLLPVETTHISTFEDRFLQSLSTLYNLSKYNLEDKK